MAIQYLQRSSPYFKKQAINNRTWMKGEEKIKIDNKWEEKGRTRYTVVQKH